MQSRSIVSANDETIKARFLPEIRRFYLFGYRLDVILDNRIFCWLNDIAFHGFCYESSALFTIVFKDNSSAKIVRGLALTSKGNYVEHSWSELRLYGMDLVFDPCWISSINQTEPELYFAEKTSYYEIIKPKIERIHTHSEFWAHDLSHELHELLRNPQTSQRYSRLLSAYREDQFYGTNEFHHKIDSLAHNPMAQEIFMRSQTALGVWPVGLKNILEIIFFTKKM